ncbi:MAG: cysteine peptidase family C39 domain-containing protein [Myxococcota bacterium]
MRALAVATLIGMGGLGAAASGCAHYVGRAKPIAASAVDAHAGWVVAAPTPTVRQRGLSDCGLAALAMVAGRWGMPLTLEEAGRGVPAPTSAGLRLADLRDAARARGLTAFAIQADRATLLHELGLGRPVIVGLLRPYSARKAISHYEVVVAMRPDDGSVATIDPAGEGDGAWLTRRWSDLEAEWKPAGRPALVVLGPAGASTTGELTPRRAEAAAAP